MQKVKLLIFEDNEDHFRQIQNICQKINTQKEIQIECYPNNDKSFFSFRKVINRFLTSHKKEARKREAKTIDKIILRENIDAFVLDFELVDTNDPDSGTTCFELIKKLDNIRSGFIYSDYYAKKGEKYLERSGTLTHKYGYPLKKYLKNGLQKSTITNMHTRDFKNAILMCLTTEDSDQEPSVKPIDKKKSLNDEAVYISYSWRDDIKNDSEQGFVTDIYDSLKKDYEVIRDKENCKYGNDLKEFMKELGKGKLIVCVISEDYLKSLNCMSEMLHIYKNDDFEKRVLPIVLDSAKPFLYDNHKSLTIYDHWKAEKESLDKEISQRGNSSEAVLALQEPAKKVDLLRDISQNTSNIISKLSNIQSGDVKQLPQNDFETVRKTIYLRISE